MITSLLEWVQSSDSSAQMYFTVLAAGNSSKHTHKHKIPPATHFTIISSPCLPSVDEHFAVWGRSLCHFVLLLLFASHGAQPTVQAEA